ncbi:MAG: hypothetical protein V1793_25030 [Pseudomonadota bacterium]
MADVQTYDWDQVDVDESVSESEIKQADNLGAGTPVGKFLCTLEDITARDNTMKAYTCTAADLKLRIDHVLELERPVIDDKTGQPIKRNGEVVMKKMPVKPEQQAEANALYGGQYLYDTVNLAHPKEKTGMKNRRLFVARRLNIITEQSTSIPTKAWPAAKGRQVVVITDWNHWEDDVTGEKKKNVKVAFDGYDFPGNVTKVDTKIDFSDI